MNTTIARAFLLKLKKTAFKSLSTLLFFALWHAASVTGILDEGIIPGPIGVIKRLFVDIFAGDLFTKHIILSFKRAGEGFLASLIGGASLGFFLKVLPERARAALMPVLRMFEKLNPLALFPVFMLFLGIGEGSKVMIIFWVAVWQIAFHTLAGLLDVDQDLVKAARVMGAGRVGVFWKVCIPAALPDIFNGVKFGAQIAFIFVVSVEMQSSSAGLGWFINNAKHIYNLFDLYAGVIVVALLGVFIGKILALVEDRLFSWKERAIR
ncbi:MAG: ABC transporter permease [Synergistaceae bacterium]|jgi:NitT/TauT family transport system permease protein|nr:ABC transporter permease [Synergistaceae bacterium]